MNQRGSVLLLIAWTITLVSVFIAGLAAQSLFGLSLTDRLSRYLQASAIAEAGVQEARRVLEDDASASFDGFNDRWAHSFSFEEHAVGEGSFTIAYRPVGPSTTPVYGLLDEERKINLNTAPVEVLHALFERIGKMKEHEATIAADSVVDWRDEDHTTQPYGAESFYYLGLSPSYESKDHPFENVEELLLVRGITPDVFARVKPYVTVYGSGQINLNTAPAEVLQALGLTPEGVKALLFYRLGEDNTPGTGDDRVLPAVSSIVGELANVLPSEDVARLVALVGGDFLTVKSEAFLATIDARSANEKYSAHVECVIDRTGRIYAWAQR